MKTNQKKNPFAFFLLQWRYKIQGVKGKMKIHVGITAYAIEIHQPKSNNTYAHNNVAFPC